MTELIKTEFTFTNSKLAIIAYLILKSFFGLFFKN